MKLPKWFLRSFRHIMPKSWLRLVSCIFCSYLSPCFERRKPPIPSPPHTLPRVTSACTNWGFHHYYPHRTHSLEPRFHFHRSRNTHILVLWLCKGMYKLIENPRFPLCGFILINLGGLLVFFSEERNCQMSESFFFKKDRTKWLEIELGA